MPSFSHSSNELSQTNKHMHTRARATARSPAHVRVYCYILESLSIYCFNSTYFKYFEIRKPNRKPALGIHRTKQPLWGGFCCCLLCLIAKVVFFAFAFTFSFSLIKFVVFLFQLKLFTNFFFSVFFCHYFRAAFPIAPNQRLTPYTYTE